MLNKRVMVLAILLAGLLVIGAASAADNGAVDIVSADDTADIDGSLYEPQEDNVEISTSDEDSDKLSTSNDDLLEIAYAEGDDIQYSAGYDGEAGSVGLNEGACDGENAAGGSSQIAAAGNDAPSDRLGEDQIGDFNILQNLINSAHAGDVITLDRNYTFAVGADENLIQNGITINKNLIINGNGYTIDAQGKSRIFYISANDVKINNITFKNGNVNDKNIDGGAIYCTCDCSNCIVSDCSFVNNTANNGGAIYLYTSGTYDFNIKNFVSSNFTVSDCNFVNNTASGDGGAIYWYDYQYCSCIVSDCSFVNNTASGDGGAIYLTTNGGTSLFFNFTTGSSIILNQVSNFTVSDCSFVNNTASHGAAIYLNERNEGSNCIVSDCIFMNNKIIPILSSIDYNYSNVLIFTIQNGNNYIDAIYASSMDITLKNVTYTYNRTMVNSNNVPIVKFDRDLSNLAITIEVYSDDALVDNVTLIPDENCNFYYGYSNLADGDYNYKAYSIGNDHYTSSSMTGNFTKTPISGDFNTLQSLIYGAREGVINLTRNYTFTVGADENLINGIVINKKNLTINGNGFTLNALGKSRIFDISANNVKINNITFINANNNDAGAIYWSGSDGSVTGCSFVNNTANNGGAIYWYAGGYCNCIVSNCSFVNNTANNGGAIYLYTSGTSDININYVSSNCSFVNNTANNGGAIYWYAGGYCNCIVSDCNFVNNTASGDGGAIYLTTKFGVDYSNGMYLRSKCTVSDCTFVNNTASYGAAIYWNERIEGSNCIVSDCIFMNNKIISNLSSIDYNYSNVLIFTIQNGNNYIDAIYASGMGITLKNVTYTYNRTMVNSNNVPIVKFDRDLSNLAITIEVYSDDALVDNVTLIPDENCNFYYGYSNLADGDYNYKAYSIGNDHYTSSSMTGNFTKTPISGDFNTLQSLIYTALEGDIINLTRNYTFTVGADENLINGIVINKKNLTINGNGFTLNALGKSRIFDISANNVKINNITFINANNNDAGAIYWSGSDGSVTGCSFVNNTANHDGSFYINGANCKITNCNFTNNNANSNGGAVYAYNGVSVVGCSFVNNTASGDGGAIYSTDYDYISNFTVSNCSFMNNTASGNGGAIYLFKRNSRSNYIVSDCSFINNTVPGDGGAIYCNDMRAVGAIYSDTHGSVSNCSFMNNTANNGGAIYSDTHGSVVDCDFVNNTANNGGAIYSDTLRSVVDCDFVNNTASGDGGAIYSVTHGSVSNCSFMNNTANNGGAIYWTLGGSVSNCSFMNNTADRGGAIYSKNGAVVGCSFMNNSASVDGGAIYWTLGGSVSNCSFENNTAQYGAAIYLISDGTVSNCSFEDNSASIFGGAIHSNKATSVVDCCFVHCSANRGGAIYWSSSGPVSNCSFVNCYAESPDSSYGGAIYFGDSGGSVSNSNFEDNFANYGGTIFSGSNSSFVNCSFVRNSASNGGAIYCFGSNSSIVDCSFSHNSAFGEGGAVYWSGRDGSISNSDFVKNSAYYGGAIKCDLYYCDIYNCSFADNSVTYDGGAIQFLKSGGPISNCSFVKNSARKNGGAIGWEKSNGDVSNCNFVNNSASHGKDMAWTNSNGTIVDSSFTTKIVLNSLHGDDENNCITLTLSGYVNYANTLYFNNSSVTLNNNSYWTGNWVNNDNPNPFITTSMGAGYNIIIEVYSGETLIDNLTLVTDEHGNAIYDYNKLSNGDYEYRAYLIGHATDIRTNGYFTVSDARDDFSSLQAYINRAKENATLTLHHNYTFTSGVDDNITDGIVIDNPLTIDGNGVVLDAKYSSRIFKVTAGNVVIKNIDFINGKALKYTGGGAIYWNGINGTLTDCNFTDNSASVDGGAVYWAASYGTLDNCIFTRNQAGYGGAIVWAGDYGTLTDCNLSENHANYGGGAIYCWCLSLNLTNCIFTGNDVTGVFPRGGGAIYWSVDNGNIIDSVFRYNKAPSAALNADINDTHLIFAFKGEENYINAIYLSSGNISFSNVTYWDGEWVNSDDAYPDLTSRAAGQNITLEIYNSSDLVKEITLVTDVSGQAEYCYMNLVDGNYSFVAYHPDDAYYTYISASGDFICKHIKPNVTFAEDFVMDYRDGSAWTVTLSDGTHPIEGAVVKVGIAGKVYNRVTDAEGVASLPINLAPGVYDINATYDGAGEYGAVFVNGTVTVNKVVATLSAVDLEMPYKDGSAWVVTLTDADGDAIVGVKVAIGICNKTYNIRTDDAGVAGIAINLQPGTYDINASFTSNKYEAQTITATITVNKAVPTLSAEDLVMSYKDGSAWNVTLKDAAGNVMANTYVKITIAGKTYNRKTNENGVASLPINLAVGNYNVSARFEGSKYLEAVEINSTVVVNPPEYNLVANDINMTYQDGTNYTVQITDTEGNPVAQKDVVIKMTINGKSYDRKTNAEGIASLPINLKAGTYEITAEYNGKQINNTVIVNKA